MLSYELYLPAIYHLRYTSCLPLSHNMAASSRLTEAAYQALPGTPLDVDKTFYDDIAASDRTKALELVVPKRSGRAWKVRAGQVCRIVAIEGPQVGDLNIWNAENPRERFWAARTRQLQRAVCRTSVSMEPKG